MVTNPFEVSGSGLLKRRSEHVDHQPDCRLSRSPARIAQGIHFHDIQPHKLSLLHQSGHVVSRAADIVGSADAAVVQNEVQMLDLPNRSVQFTWDAARYPVIMVRDARTGEVRAFLRGGQAEIEDAPSDLEVQFSDGVRSHPHSHTRSTD